jgi:protein-S-isoprenylcysteine O-methyltransferase Ste14
MESQDPNITNPNTAPKHTVHHVLAHSYSIYFIFLLLGISLDMIYPIEIFDGEVARAIGFLFLIFSSIIIIWAQKTGRDFRNIGEEVKTEHFCRGPYCYTKIPTQWGLLFLMLGFGLVTGAFFVVVFTFVSFLVSKFVFMTKHDVILKAKYGQAYEEYTKKVKFKI